MKLVDIAKKIDKSKRNDSYVNIEEIASELNLDFYGFVDQDRLRSFWIGNWLCTDTWVGYKMYFLDDEPVGVSTQIGRKCDEEFEWFSRELALKVRDYILSLIAGKEEDLCFPICDINKDIGSKFKIDYNDQIINPDKALLNSEPVKILERIRQTPDWGIDKILKVQLVDGEIKEVNVRDLDFKFNLIEENEEEKGE